ncbi:phosphoglycerate mutase [Stenotrophomonas sp. NLF4-10]|uniref:phosphoglycerate mutase n=1 Tax=Stenotrophomonas sp. NLF4-10 TaxID=2918754 RepID=UPI001EFB5B00|nr:phosphoglycerate mutase [Stenotrophomonas sp. NLF4-10]MCG8276666.1 phosphoglycerate mutase [Stenotrophomonas sp. NLF4-10]
MTHAKATLLLPARNRFPNGALPAQVANALGRADHSEGEAGEPAQLRRHFDVRPQAWSAAALTRQHDANDAGDSLWLRADPANVAPDMQGARLMASAETLRLEQDDVDALVPALQPLFAGFGFRLDAPTPSRWYLRLPDDTPLPAFAAPETVLGDDLFEHLPEGEHGRRWRSLLTEAQVLLHQHPWNEQRSAQGKRPVNSLWFWGAGRLPGSVQTGHAQVRSRDALLQALAQLAGVRVDGEHAVDALVDLRQLRSLEQLTRDAITPLLDAIARGELRELRLDFEDGAQYRIHRGQRWRFWKKPLATLAND